MGRFCHACGRKDMERPPTSQALLWTWAARGEVCGPACSPQAQAGFMPTLGRSGEAVPGAQPCLACLIPGTKGITGKGGGTAHTAAGQLGLFLADAKEPKKRKWIKTRWARGGYVCLAAFMRTSQQRKLLGLSVGGRGGSGGVKCWFLLLVFCIALLLQTWCGLLSKALRCDHFVSQLRHFTVIFHSHKKLTWF